MPDPKKVFVKRFNDFAVGDLVFIILLFSIVGTTFMAFNQLKSGIIYATLISLSFIVLLLLTLLKKDEDQPTKIIPIPFSKKFSVSAFMYIAGLITPVILSLLLGLVSLSLVSFSVPLFAGDITDGVQSFSVANLEDQMSTKIFNIVYVAGSDETIVYNWLAMLFGVVAGQILLRLLGREGSPVKNKTAVKVFAYAFSVFVFSLSHMLNDSYTNVGNFVVAGAFLLISNISMFEWGLPISYWIGFHQSNNLLYLIAVFGMAAVLSGFVGLFGIVTIVLLALILFYLINNWDVVVRDLRWWWRSGR